MRILLTSVLLIFISITTTSLNIADNDWRLLDVKEKKSLLQDLRESFEYTKLESHFEITSYPDASTSNAFDSESGKLFISGNFSKTVMMGMETFRDGQYVVTIDRNDNIITVGNEKKSDKRYDKFWLEFITEDCEIYLLESTTGKTLRFVYPKGLDYSSTVIEITNENILKKSILYFSGAVAVDPDNPKSSKSKPRIEFNYSLFNTNPVINDNIFKYEHVLKIVDNRIDLSNEFKKFRLVDTRIESLSNPINSRP